MTREEAISILKDIRYDANTKINGESLRGKACMMGIEALEEQKTGKWIPHEYGGFYCSNCKSDSLDEVDGNYVHFPARTKYCHNCGLKMEAEEMGLTDGHLAWGDDIPTESEKTYYRQIANFEKENARLLENLKIGHCKDCKYFEYDSVAKVDGIPLIVAHEICKRWGDGCKTREDGYCFLFEPKTQEVEG